MLFRYRLLLTRIIRNLSGRTVLTTHDLDKGGGLRSRRRFEELSEARIEAAAAQFPPHFHAGLIEIHQDMLAPGRPGFVIDETTFVLRMNVLEVFKDGEDGTEVKFTADYTD
jgi:hypothetical protein